MKEFIKKNFPGIQRQYGHYLRMKRIREINRLKKLSDEELKSILSEQYERKMGHKLNWENPQTYTEKIQWEKFNVDDPIRAQLADKHAVREWVANKIGSEYLIPELGVWDRFQDIDFDKLPDRFVLKTNHGSGTNLIVKDKNGFDRKDAKLNFNDWLKTDYGYVYGFERHYSKIEPKIIAEQFIEESKGELKDYKFLCFNGEPKYCWVDVDRSVHHKRCVFDLEWNLQEWIPNDHYDRCDELVEKPKNFDRMIELAKLLAEDFSQVRVDLYNQDGKIYFGEMTFTSESGLGRFSPQEYDKMLGQLWEVL